MQYNPNKNTFCKAYRSHPKIDQNRQITYTGLKYILIIKSPLSKYLGKRDF